jgi:hypothetical protein
MVFEMGRLTDAAKLDGWIPVRLNWNDRPMVDWCYLGRRSFEESFFEQTVESCFRYPANLLFRHQTAIEVLQQLSKARPGLKPTGFIFHMSRGDAAVISRILKAMPSNIVISEARPIDSVLRAHLRDEKLTELERIDWLRSMLSALGQQRLGTERNLFVIFNAWNVMELSLVRSAFPEVPWVFLYRDPLQMLTSQMEQRGPETIPGVFDSRYFGMSADSVSLREPEEYCAIVLGAICQAALQNADRRMLINHLKPTGLIRSVIAEFFGVSCSNAEIQIMNEAAQAQERNSALQANSKEKQANVSERLRQAADQLLYPIYERLEAARLAQP